MIVSVLFLSSQHLLNLHRREQNVYTFSPKSTDTTNSLTIRKDYCESYIVPALGCQINRYMSQSGGKQRSDPLGHDYIY
jgi:hypothetical protein